MSRNILNFERLVEAAPDAMVGIGPAGVIRFVNRQTELLFDYDRTDLVGQPLEILVPELSRKGHLAHRAGYFANPEARAMGTGLQLAGRRRDGTEFPVDVSLSFIETEDGLFVTAAIRDITERIKTEQELQQMAAIIRNSEDAIIGKTLDGIVMNWNPAAERMFGYSSEETVGKPIDLFNLEDRPGDINATLARIGAGQPGGHYETIRVRKDGTAFPVSVTASPIHDAGGAIVGASTITRDVTEQRKAAEAVRNLAAAEDMVRTVMGSASIGIVLAGLDGSFQVVNRAFCDLIGYDEAYVLAHRLPDFVHPDDAKDALRARARVIAGASDMGAGTLRLVRADGATVWVRRVSVLLHGGDGQANLVMVQVEDITAEHEAQEALTYQAIHDPLTGLHNRAWLLDILAVDL
ncbi:MAG TPA: PAS domain S-box protein, partial [Acidimicrobiales bacterium]|nr:PAS domain S-box protein [Acidimicrobiales bacterium]